MTGQRKIIVIGAGAAGLLAAGELLNQGQEVEILEATDHAGGRIRTVRPDDFETAVERGFEFIHGNLPISIELLKRAQIDYQPVHGHMFRIENGEWKKQNEFAEGWDELMKKMNDLKQDISLQEFLEKNFSDEKYKSLRETVNRFAAGFDVADPARASTLALRAEWMEEEDVQYRVPGGADQLINYMLNECENKGAKIYFSGRVNKISWKKNQAVVTTTDGNYFTAEKILITVPLGVLQEEPAMIEFNPQINHYIEAARKIGFGSVVKVLLQFKHNFWQETAHDLGFIFSPQKIPSWWTQLPGNENLLTGWAGGAQAEALENLAENSILEIALQSLSRIFNKTESELQQLLIASQVANWKQDIFTRGAYSFSTLETVEARKLLASSVENTIYFGGEAMYDGNSPGTLEAALVSGKQVAAKMLAV